MPRELSEETVKKMAQHPAMGIVEQTGAAPQMAAKEKHLVEEAPIEETGPLQLIDSLSLEEEFELFTVGPVQFALGIRASITKAIKSMPDGHAFDLKAFRLPFKLVPGCVGWEDIVEAIPKEQWPALRGALQTSAFADKPNHLLWRIQEWELELSDRAGGTFKVHVFCPSSQTMGYMPGITTDGFVQFQTIPGYEFAEDEQAILQEAMKNEADD